MQEHGVALLELAGVFVFVLVARSAWLAAMPFSMWVTKKMGVVENMEWRRGVAKGRPPIRYIVDGWGRVVFVEIDPDGLR